MRRKSFTLLLATGALVGALAVQGAVLNGNFCSSADVDNPELNGYAGNGPWGFQKAGIATPEGGWWNDLTSVSNPTDPTTFITPDLAYGAGTESLPGNDPNRLFYADGTPAPSSFRISWSAEKQDSNDDRISDQNPDGASIDNRHEQMMAGYLGSGAVDPSTATLTLRSSNIAAAFTSAPYDLYVYFDGDADYEGVLTRVEAIAGITGGMAYVVPEGDFIANTPGDLGDYISGVGGTINTPVTGANYMVWENLQGDFVMNITATAPEGASANVALNGFEIVGVPEPSTMVLLILVGGAGLLRRRRS